MEEFDKIMKEVFASFRVLEHIMFFGKLCVNELQTDPWLHGKLYPKSISTLRRKLNSLVKHGILSKESARTYDIPHVHHVYCATPKLNSVMVSIRNSLLDILDKSNLARIGEVEHGKGN